MNKAILKCLTGTLLALASVPVGELLAQVPQLLHYQGRAVVANTNYEGTGQFKFALVNGAGNATYWSNDGTSSAGNQPANGVSLSVTKGLYALLLGDTTLPNMTTTIPASVFNNSDVRLRVWFDGGPGFQLLTPDQRIAAVGYAMTAAGVNDGAITASKLAPNAVAAASVQDGAITAGKLAPNSIAAGNVQDGSLTAGKLASAQVVKSLNSLKDNVNLVAGANVTITPSGNNLEIAATGGGGAGWNLSGNNLTAGQFIGSVNNQPLELRVNNLPVMRFSQGISRPNIVGGHALNSIHASFEGSVIAGGGAAGAPNQIVGEGGFIGAGSGNRIDQAEYATISGGLNNTVTAQYSTIGGGRFNTSIYIDATVSGGFANMSSSIGASVGGGRFNTNSGGYAMIGGGESNACSGFYATIPGGSGNTAAGQSSFAAGHRAKALHKGSFVWGDATESDVASTAEDQFLIRASGGVGINTTSTDAALTVAPAIGERGFHISGNRVGQTDEAVALFANANVFGSSAPALRVVSQGGDSTVGALAVSIHGTGRIARFGNASDWVADITANGTINALAFNPTSDRAAKENFAPVDAKEVLAKVATLPISRWSFKADAGTPHIGPMAQDFYDAFGLGTDEKHIATVDADGVALAAIQGLHSLMKEKDAQLSALQKRLSDLEAKLAAPSR